jgi:small subunit ribosomal protein S9
MAETYTTAVGRRKTATARVKLTPAGKMSITVNGKPSGEYFNTKERESITKDAFHVDGVDGNFEIVAKVTGGGISSQAEAIRMAIARALEKQTPNLRKQLKAAGYLKRDPRGVERKKPGLKKARKAPQWSKR